ncbi:small ribosomal subunit protein eS21-like isoform X1 [Syngnathus scovelli]|uniref:small ribosomal subunit protein eS21-like isoform X3 n=1 Tax=Syngnathus scovelli TaxID=161590 RepID=UPI0021106DDD|nr:40S ribosomal protein S21-like isoform X1 [Syngnathus scovelli]XP_049580623.1 40S ribosomal protein S21-like isoform X3 [Syngnathus scovelli]XP_049580624.1 40S ribosomal protein S21-like isoform X4 [Syngnathus scovelli]XP_049617399.1 40S ribosomal protein S21-like isoform X2 [Syngnathus scovelli]XP_049617400.1 40S ribosomal protein S21-like isoform X3 [Syngnathus scovelli]XP_049617401.1 40S ribosomal protein S21-like isoform X4 [Syngnathus scovelli]
MTQQWWASSKTTMTQHTERSSASNRIIGAKDHASVQINIAEVDNVTGRFNGQFKTYAICGAIRRMGESDDSILRLAKNDGVVAKNI